MTSYAPPTPKITLVGASGTPYVFELYPWPTAFKSVGGVYAMLRQQYGTATYDVLYIGQTGDLSERFEGHHKDDCCTRRGRTHIAVRVESSETRRFAIETDLCRHYNAPCNG